MTRRRQDAKTENRNENEDFDLINGPGTTIGKFIAYLCLPLRLSGLATLRPKILNSGEVCKIDLIYLSSKFARGRS